MHGRSSYLLASNSKVGNTGLIGLQIPQTTVTRAFLQRSRDEWVVSAFTVSRNALYTGYKIRTGTKCFKMNIF